MIQLTDCTYAWSGGEPVLEGFSFTVPQGSHVALMGRNGSGKSTLGLLVKGLLTPSAGIVEVDGFSAADEVSRFEMMRRVGLVFQNPDNTIVTTTVERELAFGLENMGLPSTDIRRRVGEALDRFNLERYRHGNPSSLSGGEKQRLALASVMIMRPEYLILDEPTSLLDPWNRGQILEMIDEVVQSGATVIHITPFAEEARRAERVVIMSDGGVERDGAPDDVLTDTGGFRACDTPMHAIAAAHERESSREIILTLDHAGFRYNPGSPMEHTALRNISLTLAAGESLALVGPSGAGKTTLLEIAAGVSSPTEGTVNWRNGLLRAMAFQFPEDQMSGETVREHVAFGPENLGFDSAAAETAIMHALDSVGLEPKRYLDRDPLTLSGGEKRRAALAGVLAMSPELLVLDEPTAGLDHHGMELVLSFLRQYLNEGGAILFSTHDFGVARCLAGRAAIIERGGIIDTGPLPEVFRTSDWITALHERIIVVMYSVM